VPVVAIVPDDKNWTWVIEAQCPECGFDGSAYDPRGAGPHLRALAEEWVEILARPDVRERPNPDSWSPLEYACHVRDVFGVYEGRLFRMLTEDGPEYQNWNQDATAIDERYGSQDPSRVAVALRTAATQLADRYDTVPDDAWSRTGHRSDGSSFTIDTISRYLVHDIVHHVHDVARLA
jgi:hypothetical protein